MVTVVYYRNMADKLLVRLLPYQRDSSRLFDRIAGFSGAVFLDSNCWGGGCGRFDILAALPRCIISSSNGITTVRDANGLKQQYTDNPLEVLRTQLAPLQASEAYPFLTGAIGYFSYELGRQFEDMPAANRAEASPPEMQVGIYDWAVIVDHAARQTALVYLRGGHGCDADIAAIHALLVNECRGRIVHPFRVLSKPVCNMNRQEYLQKFKRIIDYIHAGDCYQVNFAQKFSVVVEGDSWQAYRYLRRINSAPFSAYLNFGDLQVLSISPERFLQVKAGHVVTKPIKGTRPRGHNLASDRRQIEALKSSAKDHAENLMIVDLLRNDISKSCRFSSVHVNNLLDVETFANVHHLVSTIEGDLRSDQDALDLLKGCFPGGSVTGAPKVRSMQIIAEMEPDRRNVYCGSIGYLSRHGDMDLNIAIRTAVRQGNQFSFYGGGGIVADSVGADEYRETLDKVSPLLALVDRQIQSSHKHGVL